MSTKLAEADEAQPPPINGGLRSGAGRFRQRIQNASRVEVALIGLLSLGIFWLAVVPIGFLIHETLLFDGGLSLENIKRAFGGTTGIGTLAWNTIRYALGATALSLTLGTTLAYLAVRTDAPFRRLMFVAAFVPLIVPGILHTLSWLFLGSERTGWINAFFFEVFGGRPFEIRSLPGMIWTEANNQLPLVFLLMYSAFRNMDPALEEAALTNGARLSTVIRRVTLPVVKPALLAAALIMIVLGLESFETPALLGLPAGIHVFTSRIFVLLSVFPPDYGQAGAFSLVLLLLVAAGVYAYSRLGRNQAASEVVTGKGFRPHRHHLGRLRWPIGVCVLFYFFITVVLPLGVIVLMSFQPYYSPPNGDTINNLTFDNYRYAFNNPDVVTAMKNSILLACGAATIIMLAMTLGAWFVVRSKLRFAWVLDALAFLPITIPGVVLGMALLVVYLRVPIPVYGTFWILLIAYCTRYMPYGMRYASASMRQISLELEEAAQTSGATTLQTLRRIVLPLIVPGVMAGWIFIVMSAMRELSTSLLLYSPGNQTLGVVIWELFETGYVTQLAATGVLMILFTGVLAVAAKWVSDRFGVRESGTGL